jgi:RNA polymerase sigma-70 factor (ECF subfamily)
MNFFLDKQLFISMKIIVTESQYKAMLTEGINFDTEYKRLYPKIFRQVCLRYANNDREKAQDFCQLGFIKVYQKLHMYDGTGSIDSWIQRIITNTIIDELRKEARSPKKKEIDFSRHDFDIEDDEIQESPYTLADIKSAMETLSPMYRKVFEMYYFADMSHIEIGQELGISDGTSKSNLFKAKAKVKSFLEKLAKKREG